MSATTVCKLLTRPVAVNRPSTHGKYVLQLREELRESKTKQEQKLDY